VSGGRSHSTGVVRHSTDALAVTGSMITFRAALPIVRALILAGLAVVLILFGLPAVLAFAAASPL
jgi:hypothetical protein